MSEIGREREGQQAEDEAPDAAEDRRSAMSARLTMPLALKMTIRPSDLMTSATSAEATIAAMMSGPTRGHAHEHVGDRVADE
jgi:hypothetical protein